MHVIKLLAYYITIKLLSLYKAKKCLLADFLPKSACEAGSFGERSSPRSHGPGTSEASASSPPQAKNFGLGARSAPRALAWAGHERSECAWPAAGENFFGFYCVSNP